MLILGIDTSGRQGSVALLQKDVQKDVRKDAQAEPGDFRTLSLTHLAAGRYSEQLVPAIAELLSQNGLQKNSVDLIAVASGPGSFTGLRVAIATVKGLAEAFATPVVAVSVLEAIALAATRVAQSRRTSNSGIRTTVSSDGIPVIAALDAQRAELFFGEYVITPSNPEPVQAQRESISTIASFAASFTPAPMNGQRLQPSGTRSPYPSEPADTREVFTPDESLATCLRESGVNVTMLPAPTAEDFARIAYRKFLNGVRHDVSTLDANYLRRSDAEIFSAPKLGIKSR